MGVFFYPWNWVDFDCGRRNLWVTFLFCLFACFVFDTCKHIDNVLRKPAKQTMKWLHVGVIADNDRKDLKYQGLRQEGGSSTYCSCVDSKSKQRSWAHSAIRTMRNINEITTISVIKILCCYAVVGTRNLDRWGPEFDLGTF